MIPRQTTPSPIPRWCVGIKGLYILSRCGDSHDWDFWAPTRLSLLFFGLMDVVYERGFRTKVSDETEVNERGAEVVEEHLYKPECLSFDVDEEVISELVTGGDSDLPDGADEKRKAD